MAAVGWQVLVSGWGRPINLQFPGWSFAATPFVSGISQSSPVTLEEGLVTYVCVLVSSFGVRPDFLCMEDMAARKVEGSSVGDHHREPSCHACDNTPLTPYFQTGFASAMGAIIFAILVSRDLFLLDRLAPDRMHLVHVQEGYRNLSRDYNVLALYCMFFYPLLCSG